MICWKVIIPVVWRGRHDKDDVLRAGAHVEFAFILRLLMISRPAWRSRALMFGWMEGAQRYSDLHSRQATPYTRTEVALY